MRDRVTSAETLQLKWPWRSTSNSLLTGEGSRPTAVEAWVVAHVAALSSMVLASLASLRATRASFFGLRKPNTPSGTNTKGPWGRYKRALRTAAPADVFKLARCRFVRLVRAASSCPRAFSSSAHIGACGYWAVTIVLYALPRRQDGLNFGAASCD
jgi:hypothetical protein